MVAWAPILNALPIVMEIIKLAKPVFTSGSTNNDKEEIIPTQISELQTAVTQNAESLSKIATQLKSTIEGIDSGALNIQQELHKLKFIVKISLLISASSLALSIYILLSSQL